MGADSMFEILLNSLGNTAVYVVRKDDYRILYFNDIVGEMVPGIQKGDFCRELWTGYKEACIFSGSGSIKTYSAECSQHLKLSGERKKHRLLQLLFNLTR